MVQINVQLNLGLRCPQIQKQIEFFIASDAYERINLSILLRTRLLSWYIKAEIAENAGVR